MPIDMSNYKMIYKDLVFNVVGIMPIVNFNSKNNEEKLENIEAFFINENGQLERINDKASEFRFVRR